jgi:hypothetical protein
MELEPSEAEEEKNIETLTFYPYKIVKVGNNKKLHQTF